jgi:hypothetical protein
VKHNFSGYRRFPTNALVTFRKVRPKSGLSKHMVNYICIYKGAHLKSTYVVAVVGKAFTPVGNENLVVRNFTNRVAAALKLLAVFVNNHF